MCLTSYTQGFRVHGHSDQTVEIFVALMIVSSVLPSQRAKKLRIADMVDELENRGLRMILQFADGIDGWSYLRSDRAMVGVSFN